MKKSILAICTAVAVMASATFAVPAMATGYDLVADPVFDTFTVTASKDINVPLFAEPADDSNALGDGLIARTYSGGYVMYAYLETVSGFPDHPVPAVNACGCCDSGQSTNLVPI